MLYKVIGLPYWLIIDPNWESLALVCIKKHLLQYREANKSVQSTTRLASLKYFCPMPVHLNFTLMNVKLIEYADVYERFYHISR